MKEEVGEMGILPVIGSYACLDNHCRPHKNHCIFRARKIDPRHGEGTPKAQLLPEVETNTGQFRNKIGTTGLNCRLPLLLENNR